MLIFICIYICMYVHCYLTGSSRIILFYVGVYMYVCMSLSDNIFIV